MTGDSTDVFISYRRESGAAEARLVRAALQQHGLRVFLDVTDLHTGYFDDALLARIAGTPNFVVVLSRNCLDRCTEPADWMRKEIAHAIETRRNIVPLMLPGFEFPRVLDPSIQDLPRHQGLEYTHGFFEAMIDRLITELVVPTRASKSEQLRKLFENPVDLIGISIRSYRLAQFIGSGGSGVVYRALQEPLGRTVALKLFYPIAEPFSHFYESFERGFRALGSLDHPNIAKVLDFGKTEVLDLPVVYAVTEFVRGLPLNEWSESLHNHIDAPKLRLRAAIQLTEALCAAHETTYTDNLGFEVRGVLHGDVKPGNILVTNNNEVKLLDFLLIDIQRLQDPRGIPSRQIDSGDCITSAYGTVGYMAPEQEGEGVVTVRTDIFGLGVTLFILMRPTDMGTNPSDQSLRAGLLVLISLMTSKSPETRPANLRVVMGQLDAIYHAAYEKPPASEKPSFLKKVRGWMTRGTRT